MGFDSQQGQQWPPQQQPQWQPPGQQQATWAGQPQYPYQQPPPGFPPPGRGRPPRRRRSGAGLIFGIFCGLAAVIFIAITASHGSSPAAAPAASGAPAGITAPAAQPATAAAAASTVTYVVTGSDSDVTYGPEGSSFTGSVPMRKTAAIPASPPGYYSIDAQLNGPGTVKCEILVGGKVISQSTASGSYNIASCEITQGLFSSQWQDANAG